MRSYMSYRRGMGGENTEKYLSTQERVLSCLGSEWKRSKMWENETGLVPGSFHKHRKRLLLEGSVEIRRESRRMVFYRRTSKGEEMQRGYLVKGLLEQGDFDGLGSDLVKLYADFDLDVLSESEKVRVDDLLLKMNMIFSDLMGVLGSAWIDKKLRTEYSGSLGDGVRFFQVSRVLDSLEQRWELSRDSADISEEDVLLAEIEFLRKNGLSHGDLAGNPYMWARMNKALRELPLSLDGWEALSEFRRLSRETGPLVDFVSEFGGLLPRVLVTCFSGDVEEV